MDEEPPLLAQISFLAILTLSCLLSPFLTKTASADTEMWPCLPAGRPCYYYGTPEDGYLGRPTAFASWFIVPRWLPLQVRDDWPGVAIAGYPPGTLVKLTIVGLFGWASTELRESLIGQSTIAIVADRPGGNYVDCWPLTFNRLTKGRMWVGLVYVIAQESRTRIRIRRKKR